MRAAEKMGNGGVGDLVAAHEVQRLQLAAAQQDCSQANIRQRAAPADF